MIDEAETAAARGGIGEVVCAVVVIRFHLQHGDDEKRCATQKAGLVATGDIGYFDEDLPFIWCDRAKDMIISSGGEHTHLAEIEAEATADVRRPPTAPSSASPTEEYGEAACAVVQTPTTRSSARPRSAPTCAARSLATRWLKRAESFQQRRMAP